jgi:hypothetical protein
MAEINVFKGTSLPLLRSMEGMVTMAVYEASLAPPMLPIAIETSKTRIKTAASTAREVGRGHFNVKQVVQI